MNAQKKNKKQKQHPMPFRPSKKPAFKSNLSLSFPWVYGVRGDLKALDKLFSINSFV